jgi:2-C-methyl-D-erythritol 4-phosphate cytidylyltransferase/2-C-methyl-D-erythritol 2,4-cyclodiphosphate synthase
MGPGLPKQFRDVAKKPVLRWSAEALLADGCIDFIQPVAHPNYLDLADLCLKGLPCRPSISGGTERKYSVYAGLLAIRPLLPSYVAVHDGARPIIPAGTLKLLFECMKTSVAAFPALPVSDTLKRIEHNERITTVDRTNVFRSQTPQLFEYSSLLDAYSITDTTATDDVQLIERLNQPVSHIVGSPQNIKITVEDDMLIVNALLASRI